MASGDFWEALHDARDRGGAAQGGGVRMLVTPGPSTKTPSPGRVACFRIIPPARPTHSIEATGLWTGAKPSPDARKSPLRPAFHRKATLIWSGAHYLEWRHRGR